MKPVFNWMACGWLLKREDGVYVRSNTGGILVFGTRAAAVAHRAQIREAMARAQAARKEVAVAP